MLLYTIDDQFSKKFLISLHENHLHSFFFSSFYPPIFPLHNPKEVEKKIMFDEGEREGEIGNCVGYNGVCERGKERASCFDFDHNIRFEDVTDNTTYLINASTCSYCFSFFSFFSFHVSLKCDSYLFLF